MTKSADPGGANGEAGVKKGKIAFASVDSPVFQVGLQQQPIFNSWVLTLANHRAVQRHTSEHTENIQSLK